MPTSAIRAGFDPNRGTAGSWQRIGGENPPRGSPATGIERHQVALFAVAGDPLAGERALQIDLVAG